MSSVTFPISLGGDGSTVTDDASVNTGLANGGHRLRFVPSLAQVIACMNGALTQASAFVTAAANNAGAAQGYASSAAANATTAVNAPGTQATSTTSLTMGTGNQTMVIQAGKSIVVGMQMMVARTSAPGTSFMRGTVTAYNSSTGSLTVQADYIFGSGTFTDWTISLTGAMDVTRAALTSPAFTGTPTAPTASQGTNSTQIATTAFVFQNLPRGRIFYAQGG